MLQKLSLFCCWREKLKSSSRYFFSEILHFWYEQRETGSEGKGDHFKTIAVAKLTEDEQNLWQRV